MSGRYDLTDFEWSVIQPLLPNKPRGVPRANDRRVLNGIFWVLRSGAHGHDLPERYGKWKSLHKRFTRWAKAGVWDGIFATLTSDSDNAYLMLDSTLVRAHQQAATGKGGRVTRLWGAPEVD